jgi:hypothetical protein
MKSLFHILYVYIFHFGVLLRRELSLRTKGNVINQQKSAPYPHCLYSRDGNICLNYYSRLPITNEGEKMFVLRFPLATSFCFRLWETNNHAHNHNLRLHGNKLKIYRKTTSGCRCLFSFD